MRRRTLLGALAGVVGIGGCTTRSSAPDTDRPSRYPRDDSEPASDPPAEHSTGTPRARTDPAGCLSGSPCELGGTLSLDGASVTLRNVHRRIGYAYRTFPDAAAVRVPPDRQFLILAIDATEGETADSPRPDDFELVVGDRRVGVPTTEWEASSGKLVSPAGPRQYDPENRRRGWVGLGLPKPFEGDQLGVSLRGSDDVVALPSRLVAALRDPPAFELVGFDAPRTVEPYGEVAVNLQIENVGGSDGVCPVVVNHDSPYSYDTTEIAVPTGERRRRHIAVTNAPGESGAAVSVTLHAGGESRERTVDVASE